MSRHSRCVDITTGSQVLVLWVGTGREMCCMVGAIACMLAALLQNRHHAWVLAKGRGVLIS